MTTRPPVGARVRCRSATVEYNRNGTVRPPPRGAGVFPNCQVWIQWDLNVMATGYSDDSEVVELLEILDVTPSPAGLSRARLEG